MTGTVAEELTGSNARAVCFLEKLKSKEGGTLVEFMENVRGYTLAKFLLPQEEEAEELSDLAAKSMARVLGISVEALKQNDKPSGCTYATSVSDKKILLVMSLTKALNVVLPPAEVPRLKTVGQLAKALWEAMEDGKGDPG